MTERVEDGCEKLKSAGFDLAPGKEKKFLEVLELVWDSLMLKVESGIEEVGGSGPAPKMGLNSASLTGLKLKLEEVKPLLSAPLDELLNTLVVTLVDDGCPNTFRPKPRGGDGPKEEVESNASVGVPKLDGGWLLSCRCLPKPGGTTDEETPNEGSIPNTELVFFAAVGPKTVLTACDGGWLKAVG